MRRSILTAVPWLLLLLLVLVTVVPIEWRPTIGRPNIERVTALAAVGFAFGFVYPRHIVAVAILIIGTTILLEATQLFLPTRHGREYDLAVKLVGGTFGLTLGYLSAMSLERWRRRS